MDDQTKENVQPEVEEEAQASEPSRQQEEQTSAVSDAQLEATFDERMKRLEAMVEGEQSKADRLETTAEKLETLSEELKRYEEKRQMGLKPQEAEREMFLDRIVDDYKKSPESAQVLPQATVASEDILSPVLELAGLDANDPEVIAVLRTQSDPLWQVTEITKISEARKQAPPQAPAPGAAMSTGAGQPIASETLDSVSAELEAEMAKPATPERRKRIGELRKKHKELLPKDK